MLDLDKFELELKKLTEKYGITNVVFGANYKDKFIGFHGFTGQMTSHDLMDAISNEARLYQSGRETITKHLDEIAKRSFR